MNCEDFQMVISSAFDDGTTLGTETKRHVASCAECRQFIETWQTLDQKLSALAEPVLPANFQTRLRARVAEYPRLTPAEVAERRRQYEREYAEAMALLQHRYFFPPAALMAQLAVFILAWGLFATFLGRLVIALPGAVADAADQRLFPLIGWVALMICSIYSTRFILRPAFWQPIRMRAVGAEN